MKTAMQEVANDILEIKDLSMDHIKQIIEILSVKGMKLEKQQIIDAANHGANFDASPFINAENYYSETFKND